jgi:hypothetical protein
MSKERDDILSFAVLTGRRTHEVPEPAFISTCSAFVCLFPLFSVFWGGRFAAWQVNAPEVPEEFSPRPMSNVNGRS